MSTKALHPSLPPKPAFLNTESSPPSHEYVCNAEQPEASSSAPPKPLCAMCSHQYARYTCPGCSMRTCCAACSSSHKTKTGCTGERNKVTYVPMNEYTWGKMMDDYVFLEDVGRKVGDWGSEIVRGGYMTANANARGRGDLRGRGRGTRGRGRGGAGVHQKTKRDVLKMQLEAMDIEMDLLAVGMEKRRLNQSTWDFKHQTAMLTIEFKFYKPKDPLAASSQPVPPPLTLLTHRNDIKSSLISLLRSHVPRGGKSKKESVHPEWAKQLVYPDPDNPDSFANPQCVMAAQINLTSSIGHRVKKAHYSFDASRPLAELLANTNFVEFPTIEVWSEFLGMTIDTQGVTQQEAAKPPKRRKLNPKAGKQAIAGLLGGYGSESEEEVPRNVLEALGDYAGSGEDEDIQPTAEDVDAANVDGFSDDEGDIELDPAALLELIQSVRPGGPWSADDDEAVDWGDADDDLE